MLVVNAVAMLTRKVGDYIYRVEQPSIALGKTGKATVITVSIISPWFETLCLSADVLILHLLSEHDLLPLLEERKRKGRPTIYELSDNITSLHEGVGIRGWFADPVNLALAFQYMRMADAVQVTGSGLAKQFRFINPRIVIFENQMATLGTVGRSASDRVNLGWAGSSGHKKDIETISDVIAQVMHAYPHLDFAFMGDETIYRILSVALPDGRITYTPPGTLDEYLAFLQKVDIGLAPLQDNHYNRCRSDIKFLEYASRGVVPVLSSLTPYKASVQDGETGFLYESPQELLSILSTLACDADLRNRISRTAYAYVKLNRIEDAHVERRLAFYSEFVGSSKYSSALHQDVPLVRCCEDADYFEVSTSPVENLILEGINYEVAGSYEDAIKIYHHAAEEYADYSLSWFWLGYCCLRRGNPEASRWFDEAIKRDPHSLRAYWLKAKSLKDHEPMTAFQELTAVFKRWPSYAPAAVTIAELLESYGVYTEAMHWYNEALLSNPFFSSAALGMGRIYDIQGELERAGVAFSTAADLAPAWADAQYMMAQWCFSMNDLQRSSEYCSRTLLADLSHSGAQNLIGEIEKKIITK
ncbi:MAG TPA: tetratricopeptide repeat protein [Syntrophales bacterium]|nr:tetratricopeptide repeat protein [Syntrophales bacterium]